MKNSVLLVVLVAVMLFASLPVINIVNAQESPITFMVEPEEYYALKKSETFTTNITINNVNASQRVVGVEFRLGYNDTLLEVVSVSEGPFFSQFNQSDTPPFTFFIYYIEPETDFLNGTIIPPHIVVGLALMPNATGDWPGSMPDGNGTIAQITFRAIYQPIEPDPAVSCALDLFDAVAIDDSKQHLDIEEVDGYYEITAKPPITFMVEPEEYYALKKGETFTTNVTIDNIYDSERAVGVEFRLGYNDTLLEVVSVSEGPFFSQFNQSDTPPFTFFIYYIEPETTILNETIPAHVVVGILLMPNATGDWPGSMPDGNGTIAQITFRAIYQPIEPDPAVSCALDLFDAVAIDDSKQHLDIEEVDGYYEIITALYPIVAFTYTPLRPTAGQEVVLNATDSFDPDGEIIWYYWEFEDGTKINTTDLAIIHEFDSSGWHDVKLTIKDIDELTATITHVIEVGAYAPIEVEINTNPMYFRGEVCEYNILVTYLGNPVNLDATSAILYYNGTIYTFLTGSMIQIGTGYYQIQYTIPGTAEAGSYTLIVEAEYNGMNGIGMRSFYVSDNLENIKNAIDSMQGDMLTLITDMGIIKLNLTEIKATVESIDGTTATISSSIGSLASDIADLNNSILALDGEIDTANSGIEEAKQGIEDANTNIENVQSSLSTLLYITLILAAIGAAMATITLVIFLRKS